MIVFAIYTIIIMDLSINKEIDNDHISCSVCYRDFGI